MRTGYCSTCGYDVEANDLDCCAACGTTLIEPTDAGGNMVMPLMGLTLFLLALGACVGAM